MAVPVTPRRTYPPTFSDKVIPCPLCGTDGNQIAVYEAGIEHRFGMPVLPVSDYGQARCRNCGLLYLNASVSDDYLVELYSNESVEWQKQYMAESTVVWNGATTDEEARRFTIIVELAARFRALNGARWLDFGCQTGELGEIAQQRYGATMFGVEVSADYASQADKRWGGGNRVRASVGEFVREAQQFEVISALETLEHIATPWETVREFSQALTPDAILVVTVPSAQYFKLKYHVFKAFRVVFSRRSLRDRATNTGRSVLGLCHTHPYNFSPASLTLLLARGGFSTIHVSGTGWSTRFKVCEWLARGIALLTGGKVQIFPSVVAVARVKR